MRKPHAGYECTHAKFESVAAGEVGANFEGVIGHGNFSPWRSLKILPAVYSPITAATHTAKFRR
jgi:hypothetical protein